MPPSSLRETLDRFGLRQAELARLLAVSPRTVSLWASGDADLPGPVAAYLRVLGLSGHVGLAAELRRLDGRSRMLDEGLYSLSYWPAKDGDAAKHSGDSLAVLRNGKILGSDRWGGVFVGSYGYDSSRGANLVRVRLEVPPDGELVTGYRAGPDGATVEVEAAFDRAQPKSAAEVDVAGTPLAVELTFIGPLPR